VSETAPSGPLSGLLEAAATGDAAAKDELLRRVYGELRVIARRRLVGERAGHSLGATDLVHEAYLRLVGPAGEADRWRGTRAEFFHCAAEAMRRVLIDYARKRGAVKRAGRRQRSALPVADLLDVAASEDPGEILELDDAIERLGSVDPRLEQIVRLRFYSGLSVEDTASALEISARTVRRDWAFARAWLFRELGGASGDD